MGQAIEAVADAGPLIHLYEIDAIDLLKVFSIVHIPERVVDEIRATIHTDLSKQVGSSKKHRVGRNDLAAFVQQNQLEGLHAGELAALFLCRSLSIATLLTDDLAVRHQAKNLGITPAGSLGIVVRAYHLEYISRESAVSSIQALQNVSSLFVTPAIVTLAIEQLN